MAVAAAEARAAAETAGADAVAEAIVAVEAVGADTVAGAVRAGSLVEVAGVQEGVTSETAAQASKMDEEEDEAQCVLSSSGFSAN